MAASEASTEQRLVVRSIGDAGFAVVKALDGICPLPGPEVAACIFRAPGELFARLPRETAEAMVGWRRARRSRRRSACSTGWAASSSSPSACR